MTNHPSEIEETINLFGESLWVNKQLKKQNANLEICQCGTEKIISKSEDPCRMRASLLSLVFTNQLIYTHYIEHHHELLQEFNLPILKAHSSSASHACPSWFLYRKNFNHESMLLFQRNFHASMQSLTLWLQARLDRYTPELKALINQESVSVFMNLSSYFIDVYNTIAPQTHIEDFHSQYLKTRFKISNNLALLGSDLFHYSAEQAKSKNAFAIISAYATTGEAWTEQVNLDADQSLYEDLKLLGHEPERINAYSPETGHMEPSWCVRVSWDTACDVGLKYKQDAIYYVKDDILYLSFCDERRLLVSVGEFFKHLD